MDMLFDLVAAFFTSKIALEWKIAVILAMALMAVVAMLIFI
jgi:hypothetical protein